MKAGRLLDVSFVLALTLTTGAAIAQMPQGAPAPTKQEVALMEAALKYNADPTSALYQTHDPELIKEGDTYYLFPTGCRVSSSTDLINWKFAYDIFPQPQAWVTPDIIGADKPTWGGQAGGGFGPPPAAPASATGSASVPASGAASVPATGSASASASVAPPPRRGGCGAPEIQLVNGIYYLFYNVTAFARNTSAIGVATNKTLDPASPDFEWVDHGMVVQSIPNRDMWNALDANLVMDRGTGWLVFGSFWGGIKMVKLAPDLLSLAKPEEWYALASQPRTYQLDDTDPGDGTIEGAFVYKHFQYFYLFASLDYCCRGLSSDYKVVVGRSRFVNGPYVDREGKLMSRGGGTVIAAGDDHWAGVGHNSAYTMDGKSILVMHGYDKRENGRSKLIIRELKWDRSDWPSILLSPDLTADTTRKTSASTKAAK